MTATLDDAFKALADPERRQLLLALADQHPQSVRSLDYLDDSPSEPMKNEEHRQLLMQHGHLPMLEAAGFIEWHENGRELTRGPNFDVLRPLIEYLDEETDRADVT